VSEHPGVVVNNAVGTGGVRLIAHDPSDGLKPVPVTVTVDPIGEMVGEAAIEGPDVTVTWPDAVSVPRTPATVPVTDTVYGVALALPTAGMNP
jgi:hypothetical protein